MVGMVRSSNTGCNDRDYSPFRLIPLVRLLMDAALGKVIVPVVAYNPPCHFTLKTLTILLKASQGWVLSVSSCLLLNTYYEDSNRFKLDVP